MYTGSFLTNFRVCSQQFRLPALPLVTPFRSLPQPVHRAEFTPFALSWTHVNNKIYIDEPSDNRNVYNHLDTTKHPTDKHI